MSIQSLPFYEIKAIIGLGNPGPAYFATRHNIGFRIADFFVDRYYGTWSTNKNMELSTIVVEGQVVQVIKPLTYMNDSGKVLAMLHKKGIAQENILVVHDDLELPLGKISMRFDGSAKGHNGLKSIISLGGSNFYRLRFGVDRPADRNEVPNYVLQKFKESETQIVSLIESSVSTLEDFIKARIKTS